MKNRLGLSLIVCIVVVIALLLSDNAVQARPRDYYKNGLNTRQFSPTPCDPQGIGAEECDNGETCGANDDCSSGKCKKKVCVPKKHNQRSLFRVPQL
ncbi:11312_t:CDS:2 [Paraglomus occultum]|uniref:11312_t:CDS:1 n=1 Tax=Paraglomus occultum TaxID=144539 RepID=A0A9N9BK32_9GLOM|nr:11312_t:CDS:2 [Paraglomus occultum]